MKKSKDIIILKEYSDIHFLSLLNGLSVCNLKWFTVKERGSYLSIDVINKIKNDYPVVVWDIPNPQKRIAKGQAELRDSGWKIYLDYRFWNKPD